MKQFYLVNNNIHREDFLTKRVCLKENPPDIVENDFVDAIDDLRRYEPAVLLTPVWYDERNLGNESVCIKVYTKSCATLNVSGLDFSRFLRICALALASMFI